MPPQSHGEILGPSLCSGSRHLAEINRNWRDSGLGVGKLVAWRGAMLARGNEGVAHLIKISDGVIGYVEYGFAARPRASHGGARKQGGKVHCANRRSSDAPPWLRPVTMCPMTCDLTWLIRKEIKHTRSSP